MSLISRVEITNYLTEGLESNHYANWNPMLTGITLRMDCQSSLVNITNGGGKTSMAELLLFLLSRDRNLLRRVREKSAPKGRGYTHARIEFREVDKKAFREPSLLEVDVDNLAGATRVIGVAINNDVADAPIFYSYSGTLEDSPCYTKANGVLQNVPDDVFSKRTKSLPGSQWSTFRNEGEWQAHVGDAVSMDVVRRNAIYQTKGSDDKNASFFSFKARPGETYDGAFFKYVIAPDLLSNLLNTFAVDGETGIEDTLHISLSQIVNSEREMARKKDNLERRESAIEVDLKPVVEAGSRASSAQQEMQTQLRVVKKDVALLHHFGSQDSANAILGLPRALGSLLRAGDEDARIRKALKGMVIQRDDGIVLVDKTLSELAGVEGRRIGEIADRKRIAYSSLNSQVIDFACDFGFSTSGKAGGGHYRKGYSRESVAMLLPLFADTQGATLAGLDDVFKAAFDIAQSQIDTNPAALKIHALQASLRNDTEALNKLKDQSDALGLEIERLEEQIKGREDNEAAWKKFSAMAIHLPEELRSSPKQAKEWLADEVKTLTKQIGDMNTRKGELNRGWTRYLRALDESGLAGIDGIRSQHAELEDQQRKLKAQVKSAEKASRECADKMPNLRSAEISAQALFAQCKADLARLEGLKQSLMVFQSYFGDVDPLTVEHPPKTLKDVTDKKHAAEKGLDTASAEFETLRTLQASSSRFDSIFGAGVDALTLDPVRDYKTWKEKESLAQQSMSPLEAYVAALESFAVKFSKQSPSDWIVATDQRRNALEADRRKAESSLARTVQEIDALDRLAVVDDAAFGRAWAVLGTGPQRLYAFLQSMEGTKERRIGALSALTGLLSAPVFDTVNDLAAAAELLEKHDIGIPLLLKEPLLKAIEAQGETGGTLQVMNFFGGRYSRQARILLDPQFAKDQRAQLVARKVELEAEIASIGEGLLLVDFRSADYLMATRAAEAIKRDYMGKYTVFELELKEAQAALHRLGPQIKSDALACLDARKNYLRKGGKEKQAALLEECGVWREKVERLVEELAIAGKRASPESVKAHLEAMQYAKEGSDVGHQSAKDKLDKAESGLESAKWKLQNQQDEMEVLDGNLVSARERIDAFESEGGPGRISELSLVIEFADDEGAVEFMQEFDSRSKSASDQSAQFVGFQSTVNFDRAASYYENLDKSDADLVQKVTAKKQELAGVSERANTLDKSIKLARNAELPNWANLKKAIHDLAYEIGSQAATTKGAHAEFGALEEGVYPVEAHPLYTALNTLARRLKSPSIDETQELVSLISEAQFSIQTLNPKSNLDAFDASRKAYKLAIEDYTQKNKAFCEKSRLEASTKLAAFNALELDEIERATPEHIAVLVALFERLNASLEKDREDAQKAIKAAESANQEALTQLASLMRIAEDNLDALKKVMGRYPEGCFKIKVQLAGEELILEILNELTSGIKLLSGNAGEAGRTLRRADEGKIKDFLRETLIDKIFLEPKVTFIHGGIRANESPVTDKLSTGQKVALEFMWIVRQAEYEIERGMRQLSSKQAERKRQETNRVIFVDGIFSTLSDRRIIREAFSGLGNLGGNFQIIGFLHSPTWINDSGVFPVYHVGKKLTNSNGSNLVAFSEGGRSAGTVGFFTSITKADASTA